MSTLNQVLLFLHFVGLALGFSVSFANMVMGGLLSRAAPADRAVLSRFPPIMSRLGKIGLALLWVTGGVLVYTKWGGFAAFPWQFYVKLAAVVLLRFVPESAAIARPLIGHLIRQERVELANRRMLGVEAHEIGTMWQLAENRGRSPVDDRPLHECNRHCRAFQ